MSPNPIPNILPNMDFNHFRHLRSISSIKLRGAINLINFNSQLSNLNYSFRFPREADSAHLNIQIEDESHHRLPSFTSHYRRSLNTRFLSLYKVTKFIGMNTIPGSRVYTGWQKTPSSSSRCQFRVREKHCPSLQLRSVATDSMKVTLHSEDNFLFYK